MRPRRLADPPLPPGAAAPARCRSASRGQAPGFIAAALLLAAGVAMAAAGDPDPGFNSGHAFVTQFGPTLLGGAFGIAVQPDGKPVVALRRVVVAGSIPTATLLRLTADGHLDSTFSSGFVVDNMGADAAELRAVAIQPDGKIVAAGYVKFGGNSQFVVVRRNPNGTRDNNFDGDGVATADFFVRTSDTDPSGFGDYALAVAIQGDGKIVAAGRSHVPGNADFALARFNPDGTPDISFGGDGKVTTEFGLLDSASAVAIQKNGRIVAAGTRAQGPTADFVLARYLVDGNLDPAFDTDGKVLTDFGGTDPCSGVAIQEDGKIVAVGSTSTGTATAPALARYRKNGRLDAGFGRAGVLISDLGAAAAAAAVAVQKNGRIVVGGCRAGPGGSDFLLARYQKQGRPDRSFSGDGWTATDLGGDDLATALALQGDGKIAVAGFTTGATPQGAVARYLAR